MLNAAKNAYPWFVYGEAFSMGKDYATNIFLSDQRGVIDYATQNRFFEFVEDNDDQDRTPDWGRAFQAGPDIEVFPGWDENNDFINDFNQNDNRTRENQLPDYEEPFLRYHSDRPEFLFGIDLNNNGWIDRFENDTEPDFPTNATIGVQCLRRCPSDAGDSADCGAHPAVVDFICAAQRDQLRSLHL